MTAAEPTACARKILVIDDDECCREAIELALRDHEVYTAEHGAEALELLRGGTRPDIIFCDLSMPVLDGWGFCEVWAKDPHFSHIPVILVSGEQYLDRIAIDLGVNGFLKKPLDLDTLEAAIVEHTATPMPSSFDRATSGL